MAALRQNYTDFRAPGRVVFHNLISQNESPKLADCVAKFKNEGGGKISRRVRRSRHLGVKRLAKSLRRLPVENRIDHVTSYIIFGRAHRGPWKILYAAQKSFAAQSSAKRTMTNHRAL